MAAELEALFKPFTMGDLELKNRIVLAPMTHATASKNGLANSLMAEYYAQRSSAGLIIAEATSISEQASGWCGTPGIHNDAMEDAWKQVTSAVHRRGGCIFLQLWHMGRASHSIVHGMQPPVAPSSIKLRGCAHQATRQHPYELPRALEAEEIPQIVHDFAQATIRARRAGFDGVEIHGANGCLIDQFLQSATNRRTDPDRYGGAPENRARLLLQVAAAASAAWPGRVGVRLSPGGSVDGMACPDAPALLAYVAHRLARLPLAYVHIIRSTAPHPRPPPLPDLRPLAASRPLIASGGFTAASAAAAIAGGAADLVAFGRAFVANPDLPDRLRSGLPLAPHGPPAHDHWFIGGGLPGSETPSESESGAD